MLLFKDLPPVLNVIGILLIMLSALMLIPVAVDVVLEDRDWQVFLAAAAATLFVGLSQVLIYRGTPVTLNLRQGFILTFLSWLAISAFAALPFAFSELGIGYTDAFFEAISGLTTTGATVLTGLDHAPPGLLMWRGLLQWFGGVGIVVMAVLLLPFLRIGGMQLFRMESSDTSEKALPRITQIAGSIAAVYLVLTATVTLFYWLAGMSGFDAIVHGMTTIATGGFSTSDASFGNFDSAAIHWIAISFMILGSLPFILYVQFARGRPRALFADAQVRTFLGALLAIVTGTTLWLWSDGRGFLDALTHATFNITSIITTTGYATEDYSAWGAMATVGFFVLMFVGGCTGSTAGAVKIFRYQIAASLIRKQLYRLFHPHGVDSVRYAGHRVQDDVVLSVLAFFFLYLASVLVLAVALGAFGLDFLSAISGAAAVLSNVGPALGPVIGPAGNFSSLPDPAKWLMAAGMVLGRLELFTVLVLFMPKFWTD